MDRIDALAGALRVPLVALRRIAEADRLDDRAEIQRVMRAHGWSRGVDAVLRDAQ